METSENTIESRISAILSDIRQKGFSSVQPFSIGKVEERMIQFAQVHVITLASDELYIFLAYLPNKSTLIFSFELKK